MDHASFPASKAASTSCSNQAATPEGLRGRRALRIAVLIVALGLLGSQAAWSYIVFLKDGSQLSTREKYRVDGEKAIMVLQSGVTTSLPLSEIDVEKTEQENQKVDFGSARVIEGLDKVDQINAPPPPPPERRDTLADVVRRRDAAREAANGSAVATPPPEVEDPAATAARDVPRTPAGFIDLVNLRRELLPAPEVASAISGYLTGQGLSDVSIYRGAVDTQPLVEVVTSSEALVFKALRESAGALAQIRQQFPGQVEALHLLLVSESGGRAGQFQITPAFAEQLLSGSLTPPEAFLRHVEF